MIARNRLLSVVAPVFLAAPLAAQDTWITVTPQVGFHLAPTRLYSVEGLFPRQGYLPPLSEARIGAGASVGGDVEVVIWPELPFSLRLGGSHVLLAATTVDGVLEPSDPSLPTLTEQFEIDTNISVLTAGIVFRPPMGDAPVRQHILLGLGFKHYRFDPPADDTIGFVFPASGGSATLQAGIGVDVRLAPVTLSLSVNDYVNNYVVDESLFSSEDRRTQHTLIVSLGAAFGLGPLIQASSRGPSPPPR